MAERSNNLPQLLQGLYDQDRLAKLGLGGERIIRVRTREGRAVGGGSFPASSASTSSKALKGKYASSPYSDSHARARKKKGLNISLKNLQFTLYGGMLANMTHIVLRSDTGATVRFFFRGDRAERLARYHNVQGVGSNRMKHRFFGFSDEEQGRLADLLQQQIDDLIAMANLS